MLIIRLKYVDNKIFHIKTEIPEVYFIFRDFVLFIFYLYDQRFYKTIESFVPSPSSLDSDEVSSVSFMSVSIRSGASVSSDNPVTD